MMNVNVYKGKLTKTQHKELGDSAQHVRVQTYAFVHYKRTHTNKREKEKENENEENERRAKTGIKEKRRKGEDRRRG